MQPKLACKTQPSQLSKMDDHFVGSKAGAFATTLAQLVTTPLYVIINQLMTGKGQNGVSLTNDEKKKNYFQSLLTLA
jgi:hypothetical protein